MSKTGSEQEPEIARFLATIVAGTGTSQHSSMTSQTCDPVKLDVPDSFQD